MPKQKSIHERISIIDELLQDPNGYGTAEIQAICEERLAQAGFLEKGVISINTIRNDLKWIRETYGEDVITEDRVEVKYRYYHYKDPSFSIYKKFVSVKDIPKMRQILGFLSRFRDLPLSNLVNELQEELHLDEEVTEEYIGYDTMPDLKGKEWFGPILDFITSKKAVKLTYREFGAEVPVSRVVHPYYLKQWNRRWYMMAWEQETSLYNYALDRIENIEEAEEDYIPNNGKYDFGEYFDDIIGITHLDAAEVEVKLRVAKESWNYVITKPIHSFQKVTPDPEGNGGIIRFNVIPNYELEQTILYFGENMEVLAPQSLRDRMAERLGKMNALYGKQ